SVRIHHSSLDSLSSVSSSCPLNSFTHYQLSPFSFFFFFNDTAPTEIYTLSLHDALPILKMLEGQIADLKSRLGAAADPRAKTDLDRKSTRLNSSHVAISYAVFCLKKKKKRKTRARVNKQ